MVGGRAAGSTGDYAENAPKVKADQQHRESASLDPRDGQLEGYDCVTVTMRPMAARMLPTRTHSASGATLTTALPVLWTCHASSQPRSSEQPMAFMSCL